MLAKESPHVSACIYIFIRTNGVDDVDIFFSLLLSFQMEDSCLWETVFLSENTFLMYLVMCPLQWEQNDKIKMIYCFEHSAHKFN